MASFLSPPPVRLRRLSALAPLLFILLMVWLHPSRADGSSLTQQVGEAIRTTLESSPASPRIELGREIILNADLLPDFYQERQYRPAWVDDRGFTNAARELLELLRNSGEEGLCPEDYHLVFLDPLTELEWDYRRIGVLFDPHFMADADLLLTDAFLLYSAHMIAGRVDPAEIHEGWRATTRKADLERLLRYSLERNRVAEVLEGLIPPHTGYLALREALLDYRRLAAMGGWPTIPAGPTLRLGDRDGRIVNLARRLQLGGELEQGERPDPQLFDGEMERALIRFQIRHGLNPDGVLGPRTRAELNVTVTARIRQIELNLERWRWLPKSLGDRYIRVNIADFRLEVVEDGTVALTMPVIVGTAFRRTPVFSARMSYIEFAPFWTVPPTILREDKLPIICRDPGWIERNHYEIVSWDGSQRIDPRAIDWSSMEAKDFPGLLRMKPGPWNPLGRVKFMFPNRFSVYLHDTPDRNLFKRDARTFSSGCIRVAEPLTLAQYLLTEDQGWSLQTILAATTREDPFQVPLSESIPVHIQYWTAWVDETDGALHFRPDLYWRDLDLERALEKRIYEGENRSR